MARDDREEPQLIVDRREMLHDAEGRDDQGVGRAEVEGAHLIKHEVDAPLHRGRLGREVRAAPLEHLLRAVDACDGGARARDGQQDPAGAAPHFEHIAARRFRLVYVEPDILARRIERHAVIEETEIGNRVVGRGH